MKKLLALLPALALCLALAPTARAVDQGPKSSDCHRHTDTSTTGASASLSADDSGTRNYLNHEIRLLTKLSVTNTCQSWAAVIMFLPQGPGTDWQYVRVLVAPETSRSVGRPGLEKLGIWHKPLTNWGVHAPYWLDGPCGYDGYVGTETWILAGGKLSATEPAC